MTNYKQKQDEALTADWLKDNGLDFANFNTTHIKLLQAQQQAHTLLNQHLNVLTQSQHQTLRHFNRLMANSKTRKNLKPTAAYPIFNINNKINRQLFKQHRQLVKV